MSLQKLVQETEYPPETPSLMMSRTTKVVMIVDSVSPTPFALLRRANHFQYRDDDRALQQFSDYEDPVKALTEECRRVLKSISSANQSQISSSKQSTGLRDASWSRFEDIGFSGAFDEAQDEEDEDSNFMKRRNPQGLRATPQSRTMNMGRPTTPSWADFLSSGFVDEKTNGPQPLLLPPDKILPPIETSGRGRSSQSHRPRLESDTNLEPGELASITRFDLDDAFWWVWISSLAGEEPSERKAAFGRCALVETVIPGGKWLVMEEMVKGAAPEPAEGAYIAEKKSMFSWTRRNKGLTRRKSTGKVNGELDKNSRATYKGSQSVGVSKTSIGPDQHARIQAAAAQLQQRQREHDAQQSSPVRRGRQEDNYSMKTNSVMTLQPAVMSEASPAMKWANKYDKDAIKEAYLANNAAGRGLGQSTMQSNGNGNGYHDSPGGSILQRNASSDRELPKVPETDSQSTVQDTRPAVPAKTPTPPPAPMSPEAGPSTYEQKNGTLDKEFESSRPLEAHPIERQAVQEPQPSIDYQRAQSIEPTSPTPNQQGSSPESKEKHKKLQKKTTSGGGFKKMFGRKNRESKLPENAAQALNGSKEKETQGQLQPGGATLGRRFSGFRKKSPAPSPAEEQHPVFSPTSPPIVEDDATPRRSPEPTYERPSFDPSTRESLSRVDTADAHEAQHAFSSFDQGPLEDVPAFVPDDDISDGDEAAPPPIVHRQKPDDDGGELTKQVTPVPAVQDRWAQIRKNAAERAAQRQSEEQSRGGQSAQTDNDGETSGEESE